ncbi:uncharacterized protein LOC133200969 [Saccostrea echinata]|uniref:uncharacterized protein LOC133200969 n=1 Tax=Saccostrea echinata TaxID=191078 RepID=UPI002A7EB489|nr:uncharacterized protein LOC133200969 [Saccostrea echinata]
MTASTSIMAQDVYLCNFCVQAAKICCRSCQAYLCGECVVNHLQQLTDERHDIAPLKKRRRRQCTLHPGHRCDAFCKDCQVHVCLSCLIGGHRLHDVEEYSVVIQSETRMEEEDEDEHASVDEVITESNACRKCTTFILQPVLSIRKCCTSSVVQLQCEPMSRLICCALLFTIGITLLLIGCIPFQQEFFSFLRGPLLCLVCPLFSLTPILTRPFEIVRSVLIPCHWCFCVSHCFPDCTH